MANQASSKRLPRQEIQVLLKADRVGGQLLKGLDRLVGQIGRVHGRNSGIGNIAQLPQSRLFDKLMEIDGLHNVVQEFMQQIGIGFFYSSIPISLRLFDIWFRFF